MARQKHSLPHGLANPIPVDQIRRTAEHGKTAAHLPDADDLPVNLLEKEIPKTELRDM